ncbi:FxSxx-COOH system tetratricopeptide repeat protein [Sphaerisporangium sp. B11E5]|uniref:FxSxx-COOH system tetratricopeptide repeat protein n=1 Tax=Sphaerisporangium sp. B11E5 TaxID=3153563 RepID=UPI00325D9DF8
MTGTRSDPARGTRAPQVWGKVPVRNVNFTGRDELLERLHAGIVTDVTAVVPHALHGFGGVGKTQVSVEYAHRYQSEYDVVWWIPADQPDLVKSSLAGLAPRLGIPAVAGGGTEEAAAAVLDALRRGEPYDRWLLIFDNADQPEDLADVIPQGPGHVLITSRNHRWQGRVETVAVDVFSRDESKEFLRKRASISPEDAERLAEELGDLPLALEQAGALQAESGISVDEYLRLLKERTSHLLAESKPSEYPLSMTAAWALSVSQLHDKLPEAVDVLRCCAFFGPDPIPRDVFRRSAEKVGDIRLRGILGNPILLSRAIRELGRFALAHIDSQSRSIQVHRLVQALLRDELSVDEQERYRHEVHLLLAGAAPEDPDKTGNWRRFRELIPHVRPSRVADCVDVHVRKMSLDIVYYLYRSGNFQSARSFVESFVATWQKNSGADHPDVLIGRRHLAGIVRELGAYGTAYEMDRLTVARMTDILGSENRETLVASSGLAADLRAAGEFRKAQELDEDLLARHRTVFGPKAPATLQIVNNLAVDNALNSDYVKARELHQGALSEQSSNDDVSASDVLHSWSGLARAARLCGEVEEARDVGQDAHAYGVQELGPDHLWTLRAAKDLSIAARRAGNFEVSLERARDVHDRLETLMGIDHPDTIAAASNLSNALRAVGDVGAAFHIAEEAVARYESIYGAEHPYAYGCATNLAVLYRLRGDAPGARIINEAALRGLDTRLGRDHHISLTCAVNLASDLAVLGESEEARRLGEDTLRRTKALLGDDYPMTLACAANLAIDLRQLGAEEEASRLMEEARAGYERTLTLGHPDAKIALDWARRMDCDFDPLPI